MTMTEGPDGRSRELLRGATKVHVLGPPGSGKSWLARRVGEARGWPVHHLDELAHVTGGGSPLRSQGAREALLRDISQGSAWISEGVDLGWTDPLLDAADAIVWLDDESALLRVRSILRRFAGGAVGEARAQRGWRRVGRFRSYASRLREFAGAVVAAARYATARDETPGSETRASFRAAMVGYQHKLVRCPSQSARARALDLLVGDGAGGSDDLESGAATPR